MAGKDTALELEIQKLADENAALKAKISHLEDENLLLKSDIDKLKKPVAEPVAGPPPVFSFSGRIGRPFEISGKGFGVTPGRLSIGDRQITPTRWRPDSIKGLIPPDLNMGKTLINVNGTSVEVLLYR